MNNIKAGTERVVTGAHYGWKGWLAQRVTGVIIFIWVAVMALHWLFASDLSFAGWNAFMGCGAVKTLTLFTILAVVYHAWIGVRDIWMDYVKSARVRMFLHVFTILWLLGCALYGIGAVLAI
ncbi:MAG: sdhD [Burkholderiaceae bacterium]|nr:sdhD [Burkholderiaceae bacterium]